MAAARARAKKMDRKERNKEEAKTMRDTNVEGDNSNNNSSLDSNNSSSNSEVYDLLVNQSGIPRGFQLANVCGTERPRSKVTARCLRILRK